MHIQPQPARFHAETTIEGLRVVIPASRNWFIMLFLVAWLGGWTIGETNVAGQLLNPGDKTPSGFLLFWLAGWTLGGLFAVGTVLWQLAGREILIANSLALTHRFEVFGVGVSRSYGASDIKHLRTTEYSPPPTMNQRAMLPPFFGSGHGPIAFDYGARTIRIGSSLEEAEAKSLLNSLVAHLPRQL
ncbi:hypothetical protein GJ699_19050 [Duganella sp. FT80W]|uniref:Uncharacterized protein n=1 Tax=Duganella guangzhouensis TaxID=2666084 RepID=A0A6I2L4J8_9BURK|nr:hypothetical protein [Duganella guangzhouensis]MRW92097.1 hypothetical protein [Duganella guangzhouensis]